MPYIYREARAVRANGSQIRHPYQRVKQDLFETKGGPRPIHQSQPFLPDNNNMLDTHQLGDVTAVLEAMGVLKNKKLCLSLVSGLVERIGYECAGHAGASTVTELMLISARASELVNSLDEANTN